MTTNLINNSSTHDDQSMQPPLQERIHLQVEDKSLPAGDVLNNRNMQDELPGLFVP